MKSLDFLKEGFIEDAQDVHLDHEVQMAREECYHAAENALALHKMLRHISEQQGLKGWVSAKITLANEYLNTVREHLEYELLQPQIDDVAIGMPIAENEQQGVAEGVENSYPEDFYNIVEQIMSKYAGRSGSDVSSIASSIIGFARQNPQYVEGKQQEIRTIKDYLGYNIPVNPKDPDSVEQARRTKEQARSPEGVKKVEGAIASILGFTKDAMVQVRSKPRYFGEIYKVWGDGNFTIAQGNPDAQPDPKQGIPSTVGDGFFAHYTNLKHLRPQGIKRFDDTDNTGGTISMKQGVAEADPLRTRGGIAAVTRMPRAGQTDFRSIAAGNHPESGRKFSNKDRKELPGLLKAKIKSSLGKHTKPNLPEQSFAEGIKCNHTMEGKRCPVHGLNECPGMKARALAEWKKQQRIKRLGENSTKTRSQVMEFNPVIAALAAGAGLATGAGISLKNQDPKAKTIQQKVKDLRQQQIEKDRKSALDRLANKLDQELARDNLSQDDRQDMSHINVPESNRKLRKIKEQDATQNFLTAKQPAQPQPYNATLGIQKFDPDNVDPRTGTKNSAYVDLEADELTRNIKPTFQATDAQINDPQWMRARGLIPMQDLEAGVQAAEKQNKALGSAQRSGFPTYQHQGQTYGVMNPKYGKGGTSAQPQPMTQQQIQQTAGTNIVSGTGAPVTAGSKMLTPNQRMGGVNETSAGSIAGVVNVPPKNRSKVGSLFGGTYKQKAKK